MLTYELLFMLGPTQTNQSRGSNIYEAEIFCCLIMRDNWSDRITNLKQFNFLPVFVQCFF